MQRISVDVGSSNIRACAWDQDGVSGPVVSRAAPALVRDGGRVEQDVGALVQVAEAVVRQVVGDTPVQVCLTTQRGTVVFVDEALEPVSPLISWQDRRQGGIGADYRLNRPEVVRRIHAQGSIASLLMARWTGCLSEVDATAAADVLGQRSERSDHSVRTRGSLFPDGSEVLVVGGDKNCELFGAGACAPGQVAISLGTALSMGTLVASDADGVPGTFRTPSPLPGLDTVEVGLFAGGSMLPVLEQWGVTTDGVTLPDIDGPMCIPYFAGDLFDSSARGAFLGLSAASPPEAFVSAWLESLVLELLYAEHRLGDVSGDIGLCGGGASSIVAQWLADALERPVLWWRDTECGLYGAARAASNRTGFGAFPAYSANPVRFDPRIGTRWATRLTLFACRVSALV